MPQNVIPSAVTAGHITDRTRTLQLPIGSMVKAVVAVGNGCGMPFDDAADETCYLNFVIPQDFVSGQTIRLWYHMAGANTSDDVRLTANLIALASGEALGAGHSLTSTATHEVPDTQDELAYIDLTLVHASAAKGDVCTGYLTRDADHAEDTAAGDFEVIAIEFVYTADS